MFVLLHLKIYFLSQSLEVGMDIDAVGVPLAGECSDSAVNLGSLHVPKYKSFDV